MQQGTAVGQLWAWLFLHGRTAKRVMVGNEKVTVGLTHKQVGASVALLLPPIVDEILTAHDWDFAYSVATESSRVGYSEYVLRGNEDDCADIWIIKYGPGRGVFLEELGIADTDRKEGESVSGASDSGTVYGYTRFGRSDDSFPVIQLFDTPIAVSTITYRYRRSEMGLGDIPDHFGFVVRDFLRADYEPGYQAKAEDRLSKMISRYKTGGDSPMKVRLDPKIVKGNIRRYLNQGGG